MFFSGLVLRIKIQKRWTSLTDYVDFCSILHGLQIAEYSEWRSSWAEHANRYLENWKPISFFIT